MQRIVTMALGLVLPLLVLACVVVDGSSPEAARVTGAPAAGTASASGVPELGDLIGARGSSADTQMEARGYTAVGGDTEGDGVVSYWRRERDGSCVAVRGSDGRIRFIAPAAANDCERAERATRVVARADAGGYRTVCGVMQDGGPIRYVCSVVGGDQRSAPTTLRFPDMVMVLHWVDGGRVRIELEGMVPIMGSWSESEGETDIVTPEKTWFYLSDREAAAREVESMER